MEIPDLFNIIDAQLTSKWQKEIEKNDECAYFKRQRELLDAMQVKFEGEDLELINHYALAVESSYEFVLYEISRRLVLFGIKAGLDMQKAFDEED